MDAPVITHASVADGIVTLTLTGEGVVSIYSRLSGVPAWTLSATAESTDDPIEISGLTPGRMYEFYAVAKIEELGNEKVINGEFGTDLTGWIANGWIWASGFGPDLGVAKFNYQEDEGTIYQEIATEAGKTYRISRSSMLGTPIYIIGGQEILITEYPFFYTADSSMVAIQAKADSWGDAYIDNVSFKEAITFYSPPSGVVSVFVCADQLATDAGMLARLEAWAVGILSALQNGGANLFRYVEPWRYQIGFGNSGVESFERFAPFAYVKAEFARAEREGGYDLNMRVRLTVSVGQKSPKPDGSARIGDGTRIGVSRMTDLVRAAFEGVHPGTGFNCDDFYFSDWFETVAMTDKYAAELAFEANWMTQ